MHTADPEMTRIYLEANGGSDKLSSEAVFRAMRAAIALFRKHAIPPCVVATKKEARLLTKLDPTGHKWQIGEKYYRVEQLHRTFPVPAPSPNVQPLPDSGHDAVPEQQHGHGDKGCRAGEQKQDG